MSLTGNGRWVPHLAGPLLFPHSPRGARLAVLHQALQRLTLALEVRIGND